jgi:hypothetical protein
MSTGLTPRPGTLPAAARKAGPGDLIIEEISSLDDLDVGPPPDVPVVPSAQRRPSTKAAPVEEELVGFDMAPMSLDDFEAGFTSGGDGVLEEIDAALPSAKPADDPLAELDALPGVEVRAQPAESNLPGPAPAPMPGGAQGGYSVFASRGANPRLAESLAQVMGIPVEEARALAKKPVIPVAKGLSQEAAEALRARLAALKITAKIKGK